MFGWSKREREEAAAKKEAEKRDWLAHCTQAGFTDAQAQFLFELVTIIDGKIGSRTSTAFMMSAAAMMYAGSARA